MRRNYSVSELWEAPYIMRDKTLTYVKCLTVDSNYHNINPAEFSVHQSNNPDINKYSDKINRKSIAGMPYLSQ